MNGSRILATTIYTSGTTGERDFLLGNFKTVEVTREHILAALAKTDKV